MGKRGVPGAAPDAGNPHSRNTGETRPVKRPKQEPKPAEKPFQTVKKVPGKAASFSDAAWASVAGPPSASSITAFFKRFCHAELQSPTLQDTLQEIRSALFAKEYEAAFGSELRRRAYVARWVPARAVIYQEIYGAQLALLESGEAKEKTGGQTSRRRRCICLGGGAGSEVTALAALARRPEGILVEAVDIADWRSTLEGLQVKLREAWELPALDIKFRKGSALDQGLLDTLELETAAFLTLGFTISELFIQDTQATIALLDTLSSKCRVGALLSVTESAALALSPVTLPGGSSAVSLAQALDNAMADSWETLVKEEGKWYRISKDCAAQYPLKLENTRAFERLFRKRA